MWYNIPGESTHNLQTVSGKHFFIGYSVKMMARCRGVKFLTSCQKCVIKQTPCIKISINYAFIFDLHIFQNDLRIICHSWSRNVFALYRNAITCNL